jgi:hypothetical protein
MVGLDTITFGGEYEVAFNGVQKEARYEPSFSVKVTTEGADFEDHKHFLSTFEEHEGIFRKRLQPIYRVIDHLAEDNSGNPLRTIVTVRLTLKHRGD